MEKNPFRKGKAARFPNCQWRRRICMVLAHCRRVFTSVATLSLLIPLSLLLAPPAQALVINPIFDSSIASLSNASAVESAFDAVAADYANSFSNPVAINIGLSGGSVDGYALPSNAVGASVDPLYGYFTYKQVRNFLTSFSRNNPSDTALATAVANLSPTAPSGK